jgi:hypothetical protein
MLITTIKYLNKLEKFEFGWDGYDAHPFSSGVVDLARDMICFLVYLGFSDDLGIDADVEGNIIVLLDNRQYLVKFDINANLSIEYEIDIDGILPTEGISHKEGIKEIIKEAAEHIYQLKGEK